MAKITNPKNTKRTCEFCGKAFEVTFSSDRKRFCGVVCSNRYVTALNRNRYVTALNRKKPIKRKCQFCGKEFALRYSKSKGRFCGMKCAIEGNYRKRNPLERNKEEAIRMFKEGVSLIIISRYFDATPGSIRAFAKRNGIEVP